MPGGFEYHEAEFASGTVRTRPRSPIKLEWAGRSRAPCRGQHDRPVGSFIPRLTRALIARVPRVSLSAGLEALAGDGRERRIVIAALAALTLISWAYLWLAPMPMPASSGGLRTPHYAAFTFAMWFVMMIGMMTPSAAPTLLLFERVRALVVRAGRFDPDGAVPRSAICCTWALFSAVAALVQIELIELGWIDDMAVATRGSVTALVLLAIGPLPVAAAQARMSRPLPLAGRVHLAASPARGGRCVRRWVCTMACYCLGCCWALMLLLFVGGVMNLLWVAAITALVLVEKVFVRGAWMRRAIGVACVRRRRLVMLRRRLATSGTNTAGRRSQVAQARIPANMTPVLETRVTRFMRTRRPGSASSSRFALLIAQAGALLHASSHARGRSRRLGCADAALQPLPLVFDDFLDGKRDGHRRRRACARLRALREHDRRAAHGSVRGACLPFTRSSSQPITRGSRA